MPKQPEAGSKAYPIEKGIVTASLYLYREQNVTEKLRSDMSVRLGKDKTIHMANHLNRYYRIQIDNA